MGKGIKKPSGVLIMVFDLGGGFMSEQVCKTQRHVFCALYYNLLYLNVYKFKKFKAMGNF